VRVHQARLALTVFDLLAHRRAPKVTASEVMPRGLLLGRTGRRVHGHRVGVNGDSHVVGVPSPAGMMVTARLRLERLLGEGGMGSVWVTEHLSLGAPVAVKFIPATSPRSTPSCARGRRHTSVAASVLRTDRSAEGGGRLWSDQRGAADPR